METAINVFIYGIGGVFAGMAALYLTMKIIALIAGYMPAEEE